MDSISDPRHLIGHIQARAGRRNHAKTMAEFVPYVDARLCMDLLDRYMPGWSFKIVSLSPYEATRDGDFGYVCTAELSWSSPDRALSEVGTGNNRDADVAAKGAVSDAFKRCTVQAGLRAHYALEGAWIATDEWGKPNNDADVRNAVAKWERQLAEMAGSPESAPAPALTPRDEQVFERANEVLDRMGAPRPGETRPSEPDDGFGDLAYTAEQGVASSRFYEQVLAEGGGGVDGDIDQRWQILNRAAGSDEMVKMAMARAGVRAKTGLSWGSSWRKLCTVLAEMKLEGKL